MSQPKSDNHYCTECDDFHAPDEAHTPAGNRARTVSSGYLRYLDMQRDATPEPETITFDRAPNGDITQLPPRDHTGSTIHERGCACGFCKAGFTAWPHAE